jgi:hypothetical protein
MGIICGAHAERPSITIATIAENMPSPRGKASPYTLAKEFFVPRNVKANSTLAGSLRWSQSVFLRHGDIGSGQLSKASLASKNPTD